METKKYTLTVWKIFPISVEHFTPDELKVLLKVLSDKNLFTPTELIELLEGVEVLGRDGNNYKLTTNL